ncbi:type II toxin-antitoxin system ParD family antitoxin [Acerihabitans sp. TG2]|uniref:ribbon-helix-helix domain-containing protein n=1 Tax=Acerihabitans sp. TG2 TaxID=3096008 RepID=UPI002B22C82D|nr:type II toxin-antitoxin system ParD family antitoxin [Acerihabitans sp. TG2]MEA9390070.1 type II toxin-antitoxin system ParD family antitoxin [Acerihabitans sp. TG2]
MSTMQQMIITLPTETATKVKSKVANGEYASESHVIREGLRALDARDQAMERRLREDVIPAYEALKADGSRGLSAVDVRENLARTHGVKTKKT